MLPGDDSEMKFGVLDDFVLEKPHIPPRSTSASEPFNAVTQELVRFFEQILDAHFHENARLWQTGIDTMMQKIDGLCKMQAQQIVHGETHTKPDLACVEACDAKTQPMPKKLSKTPAESSDEALERMFVLEEENKKHRKEWLDHITTHHLNLIKGCEGGKSFKCLRLPNSFRRKPATAMSRLVQTRTFSCIVMALILCNCIWSAYVTQVDMDRVFTRPIPIKPEWYSIVDSSFAYAFAIEAAIKIFAFRGNYFFGTSRRWNMCDFCLAISPLVGIRVSFVRVARIVKLIKHTQKAKSSWFVCDLREIICAFLASVSVLVMVGLTIVAIIFLFALTFMQSVASYVEVHSGNEHADLHKQFGSIPIAMLALFGCIFGGEQTPVTDALEKVGMHVRYMFGAYVFFVVFGVINVLIAIVTGKALQVGNLDKDIIVKQHQDKMRNVILEVKELFEEMGPNSDGEITWQQFRDHLKKPAVSTYFSFQGLNVLDAREMFRWMDEFDGNPSESVAFEDFLMGMLRLTGPATSSDLMVLTKQNREQKEMIQRLIDELWTKPA